MIALTDINGRAVLLAADNIAAITEVAPSQAWHGVRANVQTKADGKWVEVRESIAHIEQKLCSGEKP